MKKTEDVTGEKNALPVAGRKRMLVFKLLAICLPFLFLILLESALRIFNYGNDFSLFIKSPDHSGFLQTNPAISKKYFTQKVNATTGNHELFEIKKDSNTVRIFVLGGSSAIGYPYFHNGSFHRWLQYRLMHEYPEINFEIINLSLTAINSYSLYDFTKQLIDYEPDAVLIYAGHNEYYGALGIASTSTLGHYPKIVRFVMKLRDLRLMQLLTNTYVSLKRKFTGEEINLSKNLMQRMVGNQEIPNNSELYRAGIQQFTINMNDILGILYKQKVPVFIGDLVSNEKDLPPFISLLSDTAHAARFYPLYNTGISALKSGDTAKAWNQLLKAAAVDSSYAACNYYLGKIAYSNAHFSQAQKYFLKAKDDDALRFRAPQAINDTIRSLAGKYPNIHFVNVMREFREHSSHNIIGKETILEHLHPNLYGYALLSDAFYKSIMANKLILQSPAYAMAFDSLLKKFPITTVDSLHGQYEIMLLEEGWPFNKPISDSVKRPSNIEEQLAGAYAVHEINWAQTMNRLLHNYFEHQQWDKALRVAEAMSLEEPYSIDFYNQCGQLCMQNGLIEEATYYFKKGFGLQPDMKTARQMIILLLKTDKPAATVPYFNYITAQSEVPESLSALQVMVEQVLALKEKLVKDSSNVDILNAIAAGYLNFANADVAEKYVNYSLKLHPANTVALQLQRQVQKIRSGK